jgi:general secretion pathway protein G
MLSGGNNFSQLGIPPRPNGARRMRGFTLIEMIVVVSVIAILMAVAIPVYSQSIRRAHEKALQADLVMLNKAIVQYTIDKQKGPQSLDDLRAAGYIKEIPVDPITRETNWEVEQDEVIISFNQQDPGITGVHSASSAIGSNGQAYSTW